MGTNASAEMRYYAAACASLPDYPSSVNSGIVGDAAHQNTNTYHVGIEDLRSPGGYTNRNWEDQMPNAGRTDQAVAVDQSMNTSDMIRQWNRYLAVWADTSDPRRKYMAEFIGWNGVGSAERLDFYTGARTSASPDHKTHSHNARKRMYWNSRECTIAQLSIDRGESKQQYLISIGQGPAPAPGEDEDIMIMYHAIDDQGTQVTSDDAPVFCLVGGFGVAVNGSPVQGLLNKLASPPAAPSQGTGNSSALTKAEWNNLMDMFDVDGNRFVLNADGTLGDWQA